MLYSKALCEYYKLDSRLYKSGVHYETCLQYTKAHNVLIHVNTYKLTLHIYDIHNDITNNQKQQ